jgi:hypothetical protein
VQAPHISNFISKQVCAQAKVHVASSLVQLFACAGRPAVHTAAAQHAHLLLAGHRKLPCMVFIIIV